MQPTCRSTSLHHTKKTGQRAKVLTHSLCLVPCDRRELNPAGCPLPCGSAHIHTHTPCPGDKGRSAQMLCTYREPGCKPGKVHHQGTQRWEAHPESRGACSTCSALDLKSFFLFQAFHSIPQVSSSPWPGTVSYVCSLGQLPQNRTRPASQLMRKGGVHVGYCAHTSTEASTSM